MRCPVVGLGAGGHARVVIEILRLDGRYELIGLLDPEPATHHTEILGVPVLGTDDELPRLREEGVENFFLGVGSIADMGPRRRLYEMAEALGLQAVSAIHPSAVISPSAEIGAGVTVMPLAVVNSGVTLGRNVLVGTQAVVEHDCRISNHVFIATGAHLASTIQISDEVHVGIGACLRQMVQVGERVTIGAGAVVVKDVPPGVTVVGNPARILEHRR